MVQKNVLELIRLVFLIASTIFCFIAFLGASRKPDVVSNFPWLMMRVETRHDQVVHIHASLRAMFVESDEDSDIDELFRYFHCRNEDGPLGDLCTACYSENEVTVILMSFAFVFSLLSSMHCFYDVFFGTFDSIPKRGAIIAKKIISLTFSIATVALYKDCYDQSYEDGEQNWTVTRNRYGPGAVAMQCHLILIGLCMCMYFFVWASYPIDNSVVTKNTQVKQQGSSSTPVETITKSNPQGGNEESLYAEKRIESPHRSPRRSPREGSYRENVVVPAEDDDIALSSMDGSLE